MKPRRLPPTARAPIAELAWWELQRMRAAGLISAAELRRELHRRVVEMNGGTDPYGHLRVGDER